MLGKNVQEIAIKDMNWEVANRVIEVLVAQDYVVMVSTEEQLIIINYVYGDNCRSDRNDVAFMSREEFDEELENMTHLELYEEDYHGGE